ncbi:hypothetical protein [Oceanicella actignis]|uniref:hypothetical protein n=1 Tax=Oceanicella actignis TaxID=1189325 RepID=UPI0011E75D61|nr:hypothetical protein [Oceanicella actignis]TYO90150.1 hypothetical protein LY05_01351 [Oceanicella actignis]
MAEEALFFLETRRILLPWAETFGPANVCLRIFDAVARSRRGIVGDFFEAIGFVPPERLAPPEISVLHKVSLPPDALEFLRLTNGTAELKDGGRSQFVVDLVDMALKEKDRLHTTRAGILSAPSRMALRRRFAAPNAWAARTFLGVSQNPFPPHEAPPPPPDFDSRPEEADAATLARVAAMVLSRLRNPAAG